MYSSSQYKPVQQTVLVSNHQNGISSDHPLFYVKQKNYFLQQLSNKVAVSTKFNQIDLKRNVRVDYLINRHDQINKNIKKQQNRRKMFLNSNQFTPIVGISQEEKRKIKQQKQAQRLRQQLYNNYVEQCIIHQAPQKDSGSSHQGFQQFQLVKNNQKLNNYTVLSDYRSDPNRKKQLYLLDLQIARLKQEQNLQKLVKKKHTQCTNNQLLSRMSNTILSSYMTYFDEIFNSLMDEILQEEVVYFNSLEADYYVNERETINNNRGSKQKQESKTKNVTVNKRFSSNNDINDLAANAKAMKMMELVKQLDELAYD